MSKRLFTSESVNHQPHHGTGRRRPAADTQQQNRQDETHEVQAKIGQWRREENIAQQHRDAHRDRTPVVETKGVETVEEIHPYHDQTGNVEHIEHQFGPGISQSEIQNGVKHNANRQCAAHSGYHNVENLSIFLESCLHTLLYL